MEAPSTPSDAEQSLLRWLDSEPADAVEDDLAALRARMHDAFGGTAAGPATSDALLCALAERMGDIGGRLRPLLLARQLPVDVPLFEANEQLCVLALDVATAVSAAAGRAGRARPGGGAELCEYAIGVVTEIFVLSALAAAAPPAGTWRLAHDFAAHHEVAAAAADDPLRCAYLRLLAVAVAQPEGLTGREIAWLYDFLDARVLGAAGI